MKLSKLLLISIVLLLLCLPAMAQDATAEPAATVEAAPVTVISGEGEGTTINVTTSEAPAPVEQPSILTTVLTAVLAFLVGAGTALAGAASWIRGAVNDPVKMTLAEKLGDSVPVETVNQLTGFLDAAKTFLVEATDRQAMISKQYPPANSSMSSTGSNFTTNG